MDKRERSAFIEPQPAEVMFNQPLTPGHFLIRFRCPAIASRVAPGNFVMIRIGDGYDPLLPRPFSIYDVEQYGLAEAPETFDLVYRVEGRGTSTMARYQPGESIMVLGPLGNSFPLSPPPPRAIIVAGGIGVAPFRFLVRALRLSGPKAKPQMLFGGRTVDDLVCVDAFVEAGVEVHLCTENGSFGATGLVTDLLREVLAKREGKGDGPTVYGCGPMGMMAVVAGVCDHYGAPCFLSTERRMGCGFGVCLGCVLHLRCRQGKPAPRFALCCTDGPIFDGSELDWENLDG